MNDGLVHMTELRRCNEMYEYRLEATTLFWMYMDTVNQVVTMWSQSGHRFYHHYVMIFRCASISRLYPCERVSE